MNTIDGILMLGGGLIFATGAAVGAGTVMLWGLLKSRTLDREWEENRERQIETENDRDGTGRWGV